MNNIVTGVLLFVGGVLMLWGPYLLQHGVGNWGAIMMLGALCFIGAMINNG